MRLDNLNEWQSADVERRLAKGFGEIITVEYTDLEEQTVVVDDVATRKLVPVKKTVDIYVGKMSPGMTGPVVNILARVVSAGVSANEFNIDSITRVLDESTVTYLFSTLTGFDEEWVNENWDLVWVADVLVAFIKYNDFFKLLEKVMEIVGSLNTSETTEAEATPQPAPAPIVQLQKARSAKKG
jgi:hypothetical protein